MKIVFTSNPTTDFFYPIIAVSEELNNIVDKENLADFQMYYLSNRPFEKKSLYENGIIFKKSYSTKNKFSIKYIFGIIISLIQMFGIYPDVVFSTGGIHSYPILLSAKLLKIPVIIHEFNSIPNDTNIWAQKFAKKITVAYKQEIDFFDKNKIIHTGQPIRHNLQEPSTSGAYEFLNLEKDIPILWVIGGSDGSKNVNRIIEEILPKILNKYQVVHQTGKDDFKEMKMLTDSSLMNLKYKNRYHQFDFLNQLSMKMLAGVSDIVVSRAGSTLFEIAYWGIPSIIIPKTNSRKNYQIKNAYNYTREGACVVIEENNLGDDSLIFEINRIYNNDFIKSKMIEGAKRFSIKDAGKHIAKEIIRIALTHEK